MSPDVRTGELIVRMGEVDYGREDEEGSQVQDLPVISMYIHPEFTAPSLYADLGIVRTQEGIVFSKYVRPACLHVMPRVPYRSGIIAGWGRTGSGTHLFINR